MNPLKKKKVKGHIPISFYEAIPILTFDVTLNSKILNLKNNILLIIIQNKIKHFSYSCKLIKCKKQRK